MKAERVLLTEGPWMSYTAHVKGSDSSYIFVYRTEEKQLKAVLEEGRYQVDFLPNHLALEEFLFTMEGIKKYDRVVPSDIGASTLPFSVPTFTGNQEMPNRAKLIRDHVPEGGNLIMVNGYLTFSSVDVGSKWYDTMVQEVLSVEVLTVDDRMEHCEGVKPQVAGKYKALSDIPEDWPGVLGYNRAIPREDTVVTVGMGGDPLMAFGSYGKGRSAIFTTDCAPH